jgi:hypothetical protein
MTLAVMVFKFFIGTTVVELILSTCPSQGVGAGLTVLAYLLAVVVMVTAIFILCTSVPKQQRQIAVINSTILFFSDMLVVEFIICYLYTYCDCSCKRIRCRVAAGGVLGATCWCTCKRRHKKQRSTPGCVKSKASDITGTQTKVLI